MGRMALVILPEGGVMHRVYRTQGPSDAQMRKMVDNLAEKTGHGGIVYAIYRDKDTPPYSGDTVLWGAPDLQCALADSWEGIMDKYFEIMEG